MDNMKQLFIAGGGDKCDSMAIDKHFSLALDKEKSLIYIPNAMRGRSYQECLKWFESVFHPLGVKKIIMHTDLEKTALDPSLIGGIYIGGGDTVKLWHEVAKSHLDGQLRTLFYSGIPIYGGSAGAIILGQTILTAPEAKGLSEEESRGLDLIEGFSIYCHYDRKKSLQGIHKNVETRAIAIPEKSGIHLIDKILTVVGIESVHAFIDNEPLCLEPGDKLDIISCAKIENSGPMSL